jgi:hypothetical protein
MSLWRSLGGLALTLLGLSASATGFGGSLALSASSEQSGFLGPQFGGIYPLTSGAGYDFSGQQYAILNTIDVLVITLTVNDGDTGVGDFDRDNLFLALDGVNTGIPLNGLLNDNITTITAVKLADQAAVLTQLKADGRLVATVIDTDADGPPGDIIGFPSAQGQIITTLDIVGTFGSRPPPVPPPRQS